MPGSRCDALIREFQRQDASPLRGVFMSSVHGLAAPFYRIEQLEAWAPARHDEAAWTRKLEALRPFVAVLGGRHVGYADLQVSGRIGHFFVAAPYAGRGIGSALMDRIGDAALASGLPLVHGDVSRSAEGFFLRRGFMLEHRQTVAVRGVLLENARMCRPVTGHPGPAGSRTARHCYGTHS